MFYVTMRDKFLSGWGMAKGKSNYLIFRCNTEEEAEIVANNGVARSDMHKICIHNHMLSALSSLPKNNITQWYSKDDEQGYANWYQKDYFKNQN